MSDYLLRGSSLNGVSAVIRELGADPQQLLAESRLSGVEEDPESWVSYAQFLLFLERAAQACHCDHFGLLLSARQNINILGALGFTVQQAPDVRTALLELVARFSFHSQGANVGLTIEDDRAFLFNSSRLGGHYPIAQQEMLVCGLAYDILKLLTDPGFTPQAVGFSFAPPDDRRPFRRRFNCPVEFGWDRTGVVFDAQWLALPVSSANPSLWRLLHTYMDDLDNHHLDDFPTKVSQLIQQAMLAGDCSIERVAAILAINKRTLQRRLKDSDTSYRQLLDTVRFDAARKYLRNSRGSMAMLADMLCYADVSAFTHAFRKHHGMSPRQWQKSQQ